MSQPQTWPALRVDDWAETRDTLQMWLQIVGKIQMVSTSLVNHWWNVTYELSSCGLRTRLMRASGRTFDAEFDLVEHVLVMRATGGGRRTVTLEPKTVAQFYAEVQKALAEFGIDPVISASPNEVAPAIPFADDTTHSSYDAAAVEAFFGQLLSAERVFSEWRSGFAGKSSPAQLFWGSMDLSATRFSGRGAPDHDGAPPACPPWVMVEAESRENAAAGFWPGGASEGAFYAYAYPEPAGYRDATLSPGGFDADIGEWLLPDEEVRTSDNPDGTLLAFLENTYALTAELGRWERSLLDVNPDRIDLRRRDDG